MEKTKQTVPSVVPRHVAIIMDGNNRWAKKRFLPGVAGHKAGVDAVRAVIEVCAEAKVEVLTLFAFSSENWQRPAEEVSALMDLFFRALRREAKRLNDNNITLRIIGDRSRFHPELQAAMREAEAITAGSNRFVLQIAANYGGQWDIAQAAQRLAREVQAGHLRPDEITPELLQTCLVTGDQAGLQQFGRDLVRPQMASLHFAGKPLRSLGDVPLATIVGSDLQHKTVTASSNGLGLTHGRLQLRMEPRAITNDAQSDVVVVEALGLTTQGPEEQIHQGTDFFGRALPVFTGESEQGQHFDLGLGAHLNHRPYCIDTRFVPGDTGQKAFFRPAIIPIHDDRDMARHHGGHSLLGLFHESALTLIRPSSPLLFVWWPHQHQLRPCRSASGCQPPHGALRLR